MSVQVLLPATARWNLTEAIVPVDLACASSVTLPRRLVPGAVMVIDETVFCTTRPAITEEVVELPALSVATARKL
jgi:hypothetical protein